MLESCERALHTCWSGTRQDNQKCMTAPQLCSLKRFGKIKIRDKKRESGVQRVEGDDGKGACAADASTHLLGSCGRASCTPAGGGRSTEAQKGRRDTAAPQLCPLQRSLDAARMPTEPVVFVRQRVRRYCLAAVVASARLRAAVRCMHGRRHPHSQRTHRGMWPS